MPEYTDDEIITIAVLHGCTFFQSRSGGDEWYLDDSVDDHHPLEQEMRNNNHNFFQQGWKSPLEVAKAYCKFFNLLR